MILQFTIPGEARGKGRPKFRRFGAHVSTYTDDKTATYENLAKLAAVGALGDRAPFDEPISVSIIIRMVPPASTSRKKFAAMLAGEIMPAKKPDADNVFKAVTDGCNGVAFRDDCQIVHGLFVKLYAATAGVDVTIAPYVRATALAASLAA